MKNQINRLASSALARIIQPFQSFVQLESAAGIILLICTVIALILANSPLQNYYMEFRQLDISIGIGSAVMTKSLIHWINDGLMSVFFFVVGLEIKRELIVGELASLKRAALPVSAALGGIIVPASIYIIFNIGTPHIAGWGIPMATDIAFSLGILTILGSKVPHQLKIFLTAFAIVDDLGAVLVIALFYGGQLQIFFLGTAACVFIILLMVNWNGIHKSFVYITLGLILWLAMLGSGIHATVAGVLLAITIPVRSRMDQMHFREKIQSLVDNLGKKEHYSQKRLLDQNQQSIVRTIELSCHKVEAPLQRLEYKLHPWVTYAIMPLFAFANAGVVIDMNIISMLVSPIALGIILGLIFGKQIGISLFSWIAVKMKFAELPDGVSWKHIYGISWLGGIGFTMSLFIAGLAFVDEKVLDISKTAVIAASLVAGSIGMILLHIFTLKSGDKNRINMRNQH